MSCQTCFPGRQFWLFRVYTPWERIFCHWMWVGAVEKVIFAGGWEQVGRRKKVAVFGYSHQHPPTRTHRQVEKDFFEMGGCEWEFWERVRDYIPCNFWVPPAHFNTDIWRFLWTPTNAYGLLLVRDQICDQSQADSVKYQMYSATLFLNNGTIRKDTFQTCPLHHSNIIHCIWVSRKIKLKNLIE